MLKLEQMDQAVPVFAQLADESPEPAVLVNVFHVAAEDVDALLDAWADDARYFKAQPGFISAQLHRGIAGSCTFLNYAVWESVAAFRIAFSSPQFQAKLAQYPESATGAPHLFRKLAVKGICVA